MGKFRRKRIQKQNLPPGEPIYVGENYSETPTIEVLRYDEKNIIESKITDLNQLNPLQTVGNEITWVHVNGIHNADLVDHIGKHFGLHSLTIEDILNTEHRPKAEFFGSHLLTIIKHLQFDAKQNVLSVDQVTLVMFDHLILTFQEKGGHLFQTIKQRLNENIGQIRMRGADYLYYSQLDILMDQYLLLAEDLEDSMTALEDSILQNADNGSLHTINDYKNIILTLKKFYGPSKEILNKLLTRKQMINESNTIYYQDLYDHILQANDLIDGLRNQIYSMVDLHYTGVGQKMNEIMKVLTIVSTIFIPLTFIAGIYGMNFSHMPELNQKWAYPAFWGVMVVLGITMLFYFKKKKWL